MYGGNELKKYDKETIAKVSRVFLADDLKKRSENLKCYYNACQYKPIDSHSIQEALLKETIGKSGHVYMQTVQSTVKNLGQNREEMFSKVPITQSGVFPGFCGEKNGKSHDSKLFKSIEIDNEVKKTTIEHYAFIYAYRALIYQMWLENSLASKMTDDILTKAKSNQVVDENVLKHTVDIASLSMESTDSLEQFNRMKIKFEGYIKEDGELSGNISDSFNIDVIELNDRKLEFAGIGARFFGSQFPICYGLIPSQYNKPNLFFWVSAKNDSKTHSVLGSILSFSQVDSIANLIALTGNIMLSEELFQNLRSSRELDKLKEFIAPAQEEKHYEAKDLVANQGFILLR